MARELQLLSGGAAQALVARLQPGFTQAHGFDVKGAYGAVGAMRDKLLAGAACDVLILTQALVGELAQQGHVHADTAAALGVVKTAIAVKAGDALPDVSTREALAGALCRATGVYFPDPQKATAGIHFMKVLQFLGLEGELCGRIHTFPNGATAMAELARAPAGAIGCTQVTEILHAPGVQLAALLPKEFELATVYMAAVCAKAAQPEAAQQFVQLLAGAGAAHARRACGFENRPL